MLSREEVLDTAAAWVWVPHDARIFETEHAKVVVNDGRARVHRAEGLSAEELLEHVRELAPGVPTVWGVHDLTVPADLADALLAAGAVEEENLNVSAYDLSKGVPDLDIPDDVEVRRVDDPELLDLVYPVTSAAFDRPLPSPEFQEADKLDVARQVAAGPDRVFFRYLGLVDGVPAAHAGLTLDDGVAKLWAGSVLEEFRHRGLYRAVLAARLAEARERGARYALVKARTGTSSPILRRAGFEDYGSEREYRLPPIDAA